MKRSCPSRGIWQPAQSWVLVLSLCSEVERRNCLLHHLPFLFFLVNFVCNPFGKKIIYWVLPWGLLFSGVRNSCCWLKLCANILECVIPMGIFPEVECSSIRHRQWSPKGWLSSSKLFIPTSCSFPYRGYPWWTGLAKWGSCPKLTGGKTEPSILATISHERDILPSDERNTPPVFCLAPTDD